MIAALMARAAPALPWARAAWAFAPILLTAVLALVWVGSSSALSTARDRLAAAETQAVDLTRERDLARMQALAFAREAMQQARSAERFGRRIARVETTLSAGLEAIAREPRTLHCLATPGVARGLDVARGLRDADAAARAAVPDQSPD